MMTDMAGSPHILVVDDDRETRELLTLFLERNEMRVTAARDGQELRRLWPCGPYQLVVLDLMLPGEGGLSLARWLRETSDVPLVMLTAMGEEADRIAGLELGADDYVPKPFNPRELLARVGLDRAAEREAGNLSYGALKRLEIARALALSPKILLLDEPAAGCNAVETEEIDHLIAEVAKTGVAILLVEHDMKMVMRISNHIVVLDHGEKIAEGDPASVSRNPAVIAAYLGTEAAHADG